MSDYNDIPSIDIALGRMTLRRALERSKGNESAMRVYAARIDQLLDRRYELMIQRDSRAWA